MEEVIEKRILENLNQEEKEVYFENKNIMKKVYLIGLIDSLKLENNVSEI